MQRFRRHRAWIAAVWLTCQCLAMAAAPGAMMCGSIEKALTASTEHEDECCKGLGPGEYCPMHKHRGHGSDNAKSTAGDAASPSTPSTGCRLQSSCDPLTIAIQSLLSEVGVFPRVATVSDDLNLLRATVPMPVSVLTHTIAPDLPPPRA